MNITVPYLAWMRRRYKGRYLYARYASPITWTNEPPTCPCKLYVVTWSYGQCRFMAARVINYKPNKKG